MNKENEKDNQLTERTAALVKVNRAQQMLSQSNRTLLRAREEQALLDEICHLMLGQAVTR